MPWKFLLLMAQVIGLILKYCEEIFHLGNKMKLLSFKITSLLLMAFVTTQLSLDSKALAQNSQRYPTYAEFNSFYLKFVQTIKTNANDLLDRRTSEEKESLQSFVRSWSAINPESVPFLGSWRVDESVISIYPSTTRNRVCIFRVYINRGVSFYLGNVSKKKIYTNRYTVIFKEGRYLGEYDKLKNIYIHHSPTPLKIPETYSWIPFGNPQRADMLPQFRAAGCTHALPNK